MKKFKLDNFVENKKDDVVSTGFKVKSSVMEDFRDAQKRYKESTNSSFKTRDALEAFLIEVTVELDKASNESLKESK
jgi:hypothetical protein